MKPLVIAVRSSTLFREVTAAAAAAVAGMNAKTSAATTAAVSAAARSSGSDLYRPNVPSTRRGAQTALPLSTIHVEVVQIQPQAEDVACPIVQMVLHAHEAVSYIQLHALRDLLDSWWTPL